MTEDLQTDYQKICAEQNNIIAKRYQELRQAGAKPWQAVKRLSKEDITIRKVNMSEQQIYRILSGLGVF